MRQHYNSEYQIKFTKNSARPYWSELEAQSFFDQPKRFFIPNTEHNRQRINNANRVLTNPNPTANIAPKAIGQSQVLRDNTLTNFTETLRNAKNQTNKTFTKIDPKYLHQFVQNFRLHY
jgi:hypothetical protein